MSIEKLRKRKDENIISEIGENNLALHFIYKIWAKY